MKTSPNTNGFEQKKWHKNYNKNFLNKYFELKRYFPGYSILK